jgi:hypothetical protein
LSILVLCPTRGRPDSLRAAAESLVSTRRNGATRFLAIIDEDDPQLPQYAEEHALYHWLTVKHSGGMVAALNAAVSEILETDDGPTILGFIGDDHRFRTLGWDLEVESALADGGFAYGNDLFWPNGEIPTQVFITRKIVAALGWMGLPGCRHLYIDNAWAELGRATSSLHYLPKVVIEHLHPAAQKAEWDEGYKRVNSQLMYDRDRTVFERWRTSSLFTEDVEHVRHALGRGATV